MKRVLAVVLLCVSFGGCANMASFQATFTKDTTAIETWVAAVVAKLRANLPVIEQDVQTAIGLACQANTIAQSNVKGAKAKQYIAAAASSCAAYSAAQANPPTGSASANLLNSIWQSYTAGKAAMAVKAGP